MKKKSTVNFKRNYKVRETIWRLLSKLFISELFLFGLMYVFVSQVHIYSIFVLGSLNLILILWLFTKWMNTYYIVSEEGISKTSGVFFRRSRTFDISSIASVQVRQGIFGRILSYGDVVLENPLTKKDLHIRHVDNPYEQAGLIEKQRLKEISKNPGKKVVPL